jgi:phage tail sheath protein FI
MPKPWAVTESRPDEVICSDPKASPPLPPLVETPPEYPPRLSTCELRCLQLSLIGHCEGLRDRIALLDPPLELNSPEAMLDWREHQLATDSSYAALYYPWVMVRDRLHPGGPLRAVPPCGHVAGLYASMDLREGVHRPPANEALAGVVDIAPNYADRLRPPGTVVRGRSAGPEALGALDDVAHGLLNEHAINVIRPYPGRGVRVMGERILERNGAIRYVNVRRLLMMIAETIDERTQWTVFEPNSPLLWLDIERVVASFLTTLWQRGMLDGATREEAFLVRCDASTNPPEEVAQGRVICYVGVQPPWPAEFVIVRVGKTESGVVLLDGDRI